MFPSRVRWIGIAAAVLVAVTAPATSADAPGNPDEYPVEAIKLADALAPQLAESIKSCSVENASRVHEEVQEFIYRKWSWTSNYEKLKPYRVCFQMLDNIASTTRLVTNRYADAKPHAVAAAYDANYAACHKLADPTDRSNGISENTRWPNRFGPEPNGRPCR